MEPSARTWIAALRGSQQRLASLARTLGPQQLRGSSYCTGWTIAQVLSHLGSQAEISSRNLAAVLAGKPPLTQDDLQAIWAVWDARDPDEQAAQFLVTDADNVERFEQLGDEQLDGLRIEMFGMEFDATGLAWMRLGEHAVHEWDVAVCVDPQARIAADAVALLAGRLSLTAGWAGKPQGERFGVGIQATEPEQRFLLDVSDSVSLAAVPPGEPAAGGEPTARIEMPAEALLRLVYGRLDPAHTPPVRTLSGQIDLDLLRRTFPGL